MGSGRVLFVIAALAATSLIAGAGNARADDAKLAEGEALFETCAMCHGPSGEGNLNFFAPAIAGQTEWYLTAQLKKFRDGIRGAHFDDIRGMRMRPMARHLKRDSMVEAVAAYVATLEPVQPEAVIPDGDAARGAALYAPCVACHGVNGEGMQPLNGPRLTHTNDWYLTEQLHKFKSGVRAGTPADVTGMLMRPMSMGLDDQGMKDVVAYIMTLSK